MARKDTHRLGVDQLFAPTDPMSLGFSRTDEAPPAPLFVEQQRAHDAVQLAANSDHVGFNAFIQLPPGYPLGDSLVDELKPFAQNRPVPPDLVCINNFSDINRPKIIEVPTGTGPRLAEQISSTILQMVQRCVSGDIADPAAAVQFVAGKLSARMQSDGAGDAISSYVRSLVEDMEDRFLVRLDFSQISDDREAARVTQILQLRYGINVLVCHDGRKGAPLEENEGPPFDELFGSIDGEFLESVAGLGPAHVLRAGALHQAQGGFLVSNFDRFIPGPFAFFARILAEPNLWFPSAQGCNPICEIPNNVRVFWMATIASFHFLTEVSSLFEEAFRVSAQFDTRLDRNTDNTVHAARILARLANQELDRPLNGGAVARLIEHGARMAQHSTKIFLNLEELGDLMREANTYTKLRNAAQTDSADVDKAILKKLERSNAYREFEYERILDDRRVIETSGTAVGQINGLSVTTYAQSDFAVPNRITARVRLGEGDVVQIHREVGLSSMSHEKGQRTMEGYLVAQYGKDLPFALDATVNFEQNFYYTSGDSSSSAQLYALVSAISGVPLAQSIAVTGTMDQQGRVQEIGGVNVKIEGFFDICESRGLKGSHGVMIPRSNVPDLMLRADIVEAVAQGKFNVYAVDTIDQGLEVLTGMKAGRRNRRGQFPRGTVNWRAEERIRHYAEKRKLFGAIRRWF